MTVEKPKNFQKSLKKLLQLLKPYRISIAITLFLSLIAMGFSIFSPKLLGNMTNQIVQNLSENAGINYEALAHIAFILIAFYIISAIANYVSMWIFANVNQKLVYSLRESLSKKINKLPMSYFDRHQYGDILSRITNDVDTLSQSLNQIASQALSSVITVVGFLVMMLIISRQLTLIAVVVIPLSLLLVKFITTHSQKYFKDQQNYLGELNGHIEENYAGQTIVKAFSGEKKAEQKFNHINESLYRSSRKSQFFSGLMMPLMNFVSNL
jgi:ATP-binding cassette subfamily B protein